MFECRHAVPRSVLTIIACVLTGCAHTYVDAEGSRHVVGLVHVTLANQNQIESGALLKYCEHKLSDSR